MQMNCPLGHSDLSANQRQILVVLVQVARERRRRQQADHAGRHQLAGAAPAGAHHGGQAERRAQLHHRCGRILGGQHSTITCRQSGRKCAGVLSDGVFGVFTQARITDKRVSIVLPKIRPNVIPAPRDGSDSVGLGWQFYKYCMLAIVASVMFYALAFT